MKRKENYIIKNVGERSYLFPKYENTENSIGMIAMNETCKSIWDLLENEQTEEGIVEFMAKEYNVDKNVLEEDVKNILNAMLNISVIS